MGSARKLGQSPIPSQQVLVLNAKIIHGKPVLVVSLKPSNKFGLPIFFGQVPKASLTPGSRPASKVLPSLTYRVVWAL